jgi:cyclopropane-fatty-acyl-phospholipid synthase
MANSIQSQRAMMFNALFHGYEGPPFAIRRWDGWRWSSLNGETPACTIVVKNPLAFRSFVAEPNEITLGEAFIHGNLDVEGDIFSVFSIAEHIFNRPRSLRQQILENASAALLDLGQRIKHGSKDSPRRGQASISYHYDQPVAFFEPWLGKTLAYSCAYFRDANDALDVAQEQKLELICRKLRLQPNESLLDIGCGWGSLLLHAVSRHQVQARGITLSHEQAEVAKRRIDRAGFSKQCTVELRDYRTLTAVEPSFDKIASVGMFEHVGLRNLPQYFRIVRDRLKPGGVFLNHGIARSRLSPARKASFIDKHVFPDGHLVTLSEALEAAELQGLEVRDVENLREHYELTLRHWVEGLRRNSTTLLQHVSELTYRIWLLYMAGSAAAFRRGEIAVYQVLISRPDRGQSRLSLTRDEWMLSCANTRTSTR